MKIVFVTNYLIFHQTALWDSLLEKHPDVDLTYLATAQLDEERKRMKYEDLHRDYARYSQDFSEEELQKLFKSADIVVYAMSEDKRVNKYIRDGKHLVVISEHITKHNPIKWPLALFKHFFIKHRFLIPGKKTLLAMGYYASHDYEAFGFRDHCYRFGYLPKLEYKEEERDPYSLLYFGRLIKGKHPEHAIYALRKLRKKDPRYHLDIVGEGRYEKHLRRLARHYHLGDAVQFHPYEEHEKILDRIRKSGICFFASDRTEGWGVALNEIMSQKGIAFANTKAGSTLFLANKKNAFIYNSKKLLMKKLDIYLAMSEQQRDAVREKAYSTIKDLWNNETASDRLYELFTATLKNEDFDKYLNGPVSKYHKVPKKHISDETDLDVIEQKSHKNIALGTIFGYLTFGMAILSGLFLIPEIVSDAGIGADYYGIYTLATSLIALFLLDFGLSTTTNTFLAKLRAKGDKEGVEKFLATIFKVYLVLDVIFIAIIVILYFLVDIIYQNGYSYEQRQLLKPVLLIVGGYSVINFPSTCFTGVLSTYEKFGFSKFTEFFQKVVYFLLTLLIIKVVPDRETKLMALVTINACSGILAIAMRYIYMRVGLGIRLSLKLKVDKATVKSVFMFSVWALVLSICARLIFNITPSIIGITNFDGATETAIFGIISTIEGYVYTLGAMMSGFFMAKIARDSEGGEEEKRARIESLAEKIGKLQFFIIAMILLGFVTVGQEFIYVWQGKNFTFSQCFYIYLSIIILIAYEVIHIPEIIFETAMYADGKIKPLAINSMIKAGINLVLCFWLTRDYGAFGACIAIASARCVDLILNTLVYRKHLHISLSRYFQSIYIRGGITFVLSLAFGLVLKYENEVFGFNIGDWRLKILINGFAFVAFYLLCTVFITFNVKERREYLSFLKKMLPFKFKAKTYPARTTEKTRVLQVVGLMASGGVESFVMTYDRALHDQFEFDFVCYDNSPNILYKEIEALGGKVYLVPHIKHLGKFNRAFKKIITKERFNIIHAHLNTLNCFPLRTAMLCDYPVRISHAHATSSPKEFKRNCAKFILRMFAKSYATRFVACSESAAIYQFGKGAYKRGEVTVLNAAIDLDKFKYDNDARVRLRQQLGYQDSDIVVGNFGRLVETKNQRYILEIAKQTKTVHPELKYLLIGSGALKEEYQSIIKESDLANVTLMDATNEIAQYYNVLDVLVLPSLYEGFGLAALEAEANGLYCVLSTTVPQATLVSKYGEYLPIEKKAEPLWIKEISLRHERKDSQEILTANGFNITVSKGLLEGIYKNEK